MILLKQTHLFFLFSFVEVVAYVCISWCIGHMVFRYFIKLKAVPISFQGAIKPNVEIFSTYFLAICLLKNCEYYNIVGTVHSTTS